jgi:hypothetical protein
LLWAAGVEFSLWRGALRPRIRFALLTYGVGVLAMVGAASISGFVIPRMAMLAVPTSDVDLSITGQLFVLCAVLNRTMASLGALAMSVGIVSWSLDLVRGAVFERVVGIFGILTGVAIVVALPTGVLSLNVVGMFWVVVGQAVWGVGAGVVLYRAPLGAPH